MRNRKLQRMKGYDYSRPGAYFITICVKNMECVFGKICGGRMVLNEWGEIAKRQWEWMFIQYPYLGIDQFIIMPDHVHGIIHIISQYAPSAGNEFAGNAFVRNGRDRSVQMGQCDHSVWLGQRDRSVRWGQKTGKIKPIPELIGAFKTTSSKLIHQSGNPDFRWQKSFHDRIIRNTYELDKIRKYIAENPAAQNIMDSEIFDCNG